MDLKGIEKKKEKEPGDLTKIITGMFESAIFVLILIAFFVALIPIW